MALSFFASLRIRVQQARFFASLRTTGPTLKGNIHDRVPTNRIDGWLTAG